MDNRVSQDALIDRPISSSTASVSTGVQEAGALGIKTLYHYQAYKQEWLEQTIIDSKIYFSNPSNFNDPWDFRPTLSLGILDDPNVREKSVQWFSDVGRAWNANLSDAEHTERTTRMRSHRRFLESFIQECSQRMPDATFARCRVYCLSTKPDDMLMWSHYASSHAGVCLEFDCRIRHFGGALRVNYCKDYPTYDLSDNDFSTILLPWLTKSDAWSYEDEFRMISQEVRTMPPPPFGVLVTRNGLLRIPSDSLRSVIIGCSTRPEVEARIRRLVAARVHPPVALKRAVRKPDRYEITIQDVA